MAKLSSFRVSARRVSRFFPVKVKRIFLCTGFFKNLKLCLTVFILNPLILLVNIRIILSVIRQKGESQNGCFKKKSTLKRTRTCTYQIVRNTSFSENFACFVFLKHPFWESSFCLITDNVREIAKTWEKMKKTWNF